MKKTALLAAMLLGSVVSVPAKGFDLGVRFEVLLDISEWSPAAQVAACTSLLAGSLWLAHVCSKRRQDNWVYGNSHHERRPSWWQQVQSAVAFRLCCSRTSVRV